MKHLGKKVLIILFLVAILGGGAYFGLKWLKQDEPHAVSEAMAAPEEPVEVILDPEFIDLQPVVDEWLNTYRHGKVAVMVYDLNNNQVAASYRANEVMRPASVYKLFYAYDAYHEISTGNDDSNEPYLGEYTLGECLDLMMRISHNPCAEKMLDDPARSARVATLISEHGLVNTKSDALLTSAADVTELLKLYNTHEGWTEESWEKWRDSTLNQPPAAAGDFRQGLPSGFQTAAVYNKVGWSGGWDIYNDAALVEFPETVAEDGTKTHGRHYIVVVLTNLTSPTANAGLGEMLEAAILADGAEESEPAVDDKSATENQ